MIIDTTHTPPLRQRLLALAIVVLIMAGVLLAGWLLFHQPVGSTGSPTVPVVELVETRLRHRCRDGGVPAVIELSPHVYKAVCAKGD